jgi:hypothetical protein
MYADEVTQAVHKGTMRWTAEESGFNSRHRQEMFPLFTVSRSTLSPTHPFIHSVSGLLSWGKSAGK